ncbi:HAMP domain-containing protein [Deinococcus sp. KNUC1210]|uniref:histidine kinase dimerization/phospho-acceptor domain-containing protein n=1 Tax=Deinococcus sp. KNUC1210 TaxID=2917691 RepID=UPI001EF1353B|nr:histidine kinase dimerization/phospho-acceptor domain-containing protein [Deinococcus sp. KNUC1210]ULH15209.1 HAMP domain-containing protein [Deinococcus sp. KNUC1210]
MSRRDERWRAVVESSSAERFVHKRREKLEKRRRRRTGLRARLTRMFALVAVLAVALSSVLTVGSIFRALSKAEISIGSVQLGTGQTGATQTGSSDGASTPASSGPSAATWRARFADPTFRAAGTALGGEIIRSATNAALLSALLAAIVAGIVTRQITRPLVRLTEGAQRLESGERGVQVQVPPRADELQTLTLTFNALTIRLARQEAWRRGLMADIAHDLRTPLSVLRSEIEAMQDGLSTPDEAGLTRLHGEVLLLARLVSDLRTLSLAESGALSLHPVRLDVAGTLRGVASSHAGRAAAAGTELSLDAPRPLFIQADADRLTQIFNNLIDNALRYAAPTPPPAAAWT